MALGDQSRLLGLSSSLIVTTCGVGWCDDGCGGDRFDGADRNHGHQSVDRATLAYDVESVVAAAAAVVVVAAAADDDVFALRVDPGEWFVECSGDWRDYWG